MAVRYDITGHPLLSEAAAVLGANELEAHTQVAERMLGVLDLQEFPSTDRRYDDLRGALALQVSYQVEAGIEAFILAEHVRGARRETYRGASRKMSPVHPQARRLVAAVNRTLSSTTVAR